MRPVALHKVYQVVHAVHIPVIGLGGIVNYRDALEFLIAGARAVQVGTASFLDPAAAVQVAEGLEAHMSKTGIHRVEHIVKGMR